MKEKPHPNCYSSRYYRIPGFSWGYSSDQALPEIGSHQTRPGSRQTRPVSYKDLSPPFLEVKSVNFVLQIIYWCTYRRLGLRATSLFFRVIQWLGPALCHTAFFKVKCINLVFTNYLLVYLQVPVFCGDYKSSFVSYRKPYRANPRAGSFYDNEVPAWLVKWNSQLGSAILIQGPDTGSSSLIGSSHVFGNVLCSVIIFYLHFSCICSSDLMQ